jgi:hypothetical protein
VPPNDELQRTRDGNAAASPLNSVLAGPRTMDPFPKEHELISFFESEPELLDKQVPWAYNQLRFEVRQGEDYIVCEIEPGYEQLRIRWQRGGTEVVTLDLNTVVGLVVEAEGGGETLVAMLRDPHLHDLRFRLRPKPHLEWGTDA